MRWIQLPPEFQTAYELQRQVFDQLSIEEKLDYLFDKIWQQGLDMSSALGELESQLEAHRRDWLLHV